MLSPTSNQMTNRNQFSLGSESINKTQRMIPSDGNTGEKGHRNGRKRSGSVYRRINTEVQTRAKAKRVPMLVRSAKMLNGRRLAAVATITPVSTVDLYGVWYLE